MDEMKLSTKLMKGLIANLIKKALKKKLGCEVKLNLNDFYITYDETNAKVHLDLNAERDKDNLETVLLANDLL